MFQRNQKIMVRILLAVIIFIVCFLCIDDPFGQGSDKNKNNITTVSASTMRRSASVSTYHNYQTRQEKNTCRHAGCNNICDSHKYCTSHRCIYGSCENQRKSGGYAYCKLHLPSDTNSKTEKWTLKKRSNSKSTSSDSSSDASDYDDPEDFYADYADEYDSYEDAEDEWYDAHPQE